MLYMDRAMALGHNVEEIYYLISSPSYKGLPSLL